MIFDPDNLVIQRCAKGMELEGESRMDEAALVFRQAWEESTNDFERFTSAHYIARHQNTVADKLTWDETALNLALRIKDEGMNAHYPSLYLNVAKGFEDLNDHDSASKHYHLALSYLDFLPDDGYGKMIRSGVNKGLERVSISDRAES